ncbi:cleavage stimulation factor subunit 2-like [Contarinia nasturtii]|uniref:cleavage stimulation factor subunit 2-like n=1 Tax=Contarinia nasturtii TaxID=265458 RepID=UPI0012D454FF|nr:cleavage stimulation factor subunit 2-like [Contarinia nasturtii]
MDEKMGEENSKTRDIIEKSLRTVFIGNITQKITEDQLRGIFGEFGYVRSLKFIEDTDSAKKHKGYGFCEYKNRETALNALRNLNGYEIDGHKLIVDNLCSEKLRMVQAQLMVERPHKKIANPYDTFCNDEQAPEIITRIVTSTAPEQMYEFMKQMKLYIQKNPSGAHQMLVLNPQLAYALVQSMVVMGIVDPQKAVSILFKPSKMPPVKNTNEKIPENSIDSNSSIPLQNNAIVKKDVDFPEIDSTIRERHYFTGCFDISPPPTKVNGSQPSTSHKRSLDLITKSPESSKKTKYSSATAQIDDVNDPETQLLMQVMTLSDDTIASLPADLKSAFHVLKKEFGVNTAN